MCRKTPYVKTKKRVGRRKRRKKKVVGSVAALLASAKDNPTVHEAMKEFETGDHQLRCSLRKALL